MDGKQFFTRGWPGVVERGGCNVKLRGNTDIVNVILFARISRYMHMVIGKKRPYCQWDNMEE